MLFDFIYIVLALSVLGMNIIPAFMPPTWVVLAFFYIHFNLSLLVVVLIGASAATCGRVVLSILARLYLRPFFPATILANYDSLGRYFENNQQLTVPIVLAYAFLPIPSNQVFIIAGLARVNIKIIALSFFIGRLISYSFWISLAHQVAGRLEVIFIRHFSSVETLILELIGLLIIYLVGKIDWKKVLRMKDAANDS